MKNILLISEDNIRTYSNLNDNVWGKFLLPAIREAQEMGLATIIGECLYNKLCDLVGNDLIDDDLYVAYKDLLDNYVQPYLIYQTLTNITPLINGKMGNIGTVTTNDEHIINLSQGELDLVQNYYRERADFYQIRLQNWVKNNSEAFPELNCNCGSPQPNLDRANNSVGLWLGGVRGKKVSSNSCGCGSKSGSQGGDYAQGFSDGYASGRTAQRNLIEPLTVYDNGTYESENGFSPVIVEAEGGKLQAKSVELPPFGVSAMTVFPDDGYYGLSMAEIDASYALSESFGAGRAQGYQEGVVNTKNRMQTITATTNGNYEVNDGYKKVTVAVPQTGVSVTITGGSITVTADTMTELAPDNTAWSSMTVDANDYGTSKYGEGYANGLNDGSQVGTEIEVQSNVSLTEYGTYVFTYDGGTGVQSMTITFDNSGQTQVIGDVEIKCWGGVQLNGDPLYNTDADDSNLLSIYVNDVEITGNTYSGVVQSVKYNFDDDVLPDAFFSGINFGDYCTVRKLNIYDYALAETNFRGISIIAGDDTYISENAIVDNENLRSFNLDAITVTRDWIISCEPSSIVNNPNLNNINLFTSSRVTVDADETLFYGSAEEGSIWANRVYVQGEPWFDNISGWTIKKQGEPDELE